MKNRIFFILTIFVLLTAPATTYAGFLVKKHTTVQAVAATAVKTEKTTLAGTAWQESISELRDAISPSSGFLRMLRKGQVSTIALFCGIFGFFIPVLAVIAIVFGFIGFQDRHSRKRGIGVAAFVLGVAAIVMVALLGPIAVF